MGIDDAIRHHEAGHLGEAERLYRSMLDAEPHHADALHLLGVLLTQVGQYDGAVENIQAALDVNRDSALFQSSLAQVFFRTGKFVEAIQMLERVVARQPDSFQAFSDLGAALQESGALDRAIEAYRRSIELNPSLAIVHFNLGTALKQQGGSADAIACVEKAVAMDPTQAGYSATLAGYYLEANEPAAALRLCRVSLSVAPRNLTALTFLSIALYRLGDRESAAEIVDFHRLIQHSRPAAPAGYESVSAFNDALANHVRSHPTLRSEPVNNATRYGKHTDNLLVNPSGPIPALAELIEKAVVDYLQSLPIDRRHPYLAHRPSGFKYTMWSVVMDSQGHQLPHLHPDGWVSGVYYVALPGAMHAATGGQDGWIEFGRPLRELMGSLEPEVETVRPEEGMLVLFPSYFYHQTIPFESAEQRICIAFDAVPRFG
jgi:tetratricopeptide (TPR) repeat protein